MNRKNEAMITPKQTSFYTPWSNKINFFKLSKWHYLFDDLNNKNTEIFYDI